MVTPNLDTNADLCLAPKTRLLFSTANKAMFLFPSITHDRFQGEKSNSAANSAGKELKKMGGPVH